MPRIALFLVLLATPVTASPAAATRLKDVFPASSLQNQANVTSSKPKFSGQFFGGNFTGGMTTTHTLNLFSRYLCRCTVFTSDSFGVSMRPVICSPSGVCRSSNPATFGTAAFPRHVASIVGWSAKKEMLGANARRIIATMTDEKSGWYRADESEIGIAMGGYFSSLTRPAETTVAGTLSAGPKPASFCFNDVPPETFFRVSATVSASARKQDAKNILSDGPLFSANAAAVPPPRVVLVNGRGADDSDVIESLTGKINAAGYDGRSHDRVSLSDGLWSGPRRGNQPRTARFLSTLPNRFCKVG